MDIAGGTWSKAGFHHKFFLSKSGINFFVIAIATLPLAMTATRVAIQ
ncbi:hypothetical protein RVIR1_06510 [Candidatus Rickettsiella viridis]|uniref:Uncharacterized protein n=1 Tax=Candidatus Rickettsiella viridis TaxID=676208 RepID=A0A2Z5UUC9_9COXI|nr:hypothetical protein RVIR1_06510 [Candidatus Rickettsiella viridis]